MESGSVDASAIEDWETVSLPLQKCSNDSTEEIEVSFWTDATSMPDEPIGIPYYKPSSKAATPAQIGDEPLPSGAQLGLSFRYVQDTGICRIDCPQ